jgi:hypothetical protein
VAAGSVQKGEERESFSRSRRRSQPAASRLLAVLVLAASLGVVLAASATAKPALHESAPAAHKHAPQTSTDNDGTQTANLSVASKRDRQRRALTRRAACRGGTSRATRRNSRVIHTALIRLSHDGVIVREHHRGAHVRRISVREAIEVLETRRVIEALAAGYAAIRRTDGEVTELRGGFSKRWNS